MKKNSNSNCFLVIHDGLFFPLCLSNGNCPEICFYSSQVLEVNDLKWKQTNFWVLQKRLTWRTFDAVISSPFRHLLSPHTSGHRAATLLARSSQSRGKAKLLLQVPNWPYNSFSAEGILPLKKFYFPSFPLYSAANLAFPCSQNKRAPYCHILLFHTSPSVLFSCFPPSLLLWQLLPFLTHKQWPWSAVFSLRCFTEVLPRWQSQ